MTIHDEDRLVPVTDTRGILLLDEDERDEPLLGSVLLVNGYHGTAWQRMFVDGLWHSTRGGTPRTWEQLITKRNVVLVYDAPARDDQRGQ